MADISLRQLASTTMSNTVSVIARKLDRKWPPPPPIFVRNLVCCSPNVGWTNYPATQSLLSVSYLCTPESLEDIVSNIREAEANQMHVHAFGSTWSFSDCAITPDYLIDTTRLNKPIQTVQKALRDGQSSFVYHVEAGITIKDLYTNLDRLGLALVTMGGSSGQTLAGAISTGTHGGDKFMAPLADSVLAIHLVGTGGTQYWVEPSSGITDSSLLRQFVVPDIEPKNIIYDDATFDAVLVSLGCMGIIYAVVLRVREPYDLVETTVTTTWREFLQTASAHLNDPVNRFLQVAVDPYTDSNNNNLCLVTTRAEAPLTDPVQRPDTSGAIKTAFENMVNSLDFDDRIKLKLNGVFDFTGLSQNQQVAKVVQGILTQTPDQRHVMVEHYGNILLAALPTGTFRGSSYSVMDTTYGQSVKSSDPGYSIELFFQSIDVNGELGFVRFVNAVIAAINAATETFLTGYVSLRFTGSTRACLGMQQWNQTCAVEISVVQGVQGELPLLTNILDMVYQYSGIPHWGQLIDLNVHGHGSIYPRYAQWRQVYANMSNNFTTRTFENALSSRWQLTSP